MCWGDPGRGGDCTQVTTFGRYFTGPVYSTERAFAARLTDGSVACWGDAAYGGDCTGLDLRGFAVVASGRSRRALAVTTQGSTYRKHANLSC